MTEQALEKPRPIADGDSQAYWDGIKNGQLLLQHCSDCGHVQYYQQRRCRQCQSDALVHKPASGKGLIHSYSVVHRAPGPAFKDDVPYAVLLVTLDEGPRMISSLVGKNFDALDFDKAVKLQIVHTGDDVYLPCFVLDT
ncbi:MAG: hypothetical protein COB26_07700 [Piscirickettsiaceae bacterium]|nr:MAG: hypothetical protein COB89_06640 [Piscirickettsiaceae bacterium]PCI68825.1 MAG: hypothetical protein COB26_07700 [Piscirickettsiaceae bacterium]